MSGDLSFLWQQVRGKRQRSSSFDRSGGNRDFCEFEPGERKILLEKEKCSGYIARIWFTLKSLEDPDYLQNIKITCTFDREKTVNNIPVGMFTATGPWRVNDLCSPLLNIMRARPVNSDDPGTGRGSFNVHWPMPFEESVKVEIFNDSPYKVTQHFYLDYIERKFEEAPLLFKAWHNTASPTKPVIREKAASHPEEVVFVEDDEVKNLTNKYNYMFADIKGERGHYAGTVLAVESHPDCRGKWYEGDDMFFIDGEEWPPSLHGTGTEDYFGMAWGCHRPYQAFDHGVTHYERSITGHDRMWDGRFVLYRWHLNDPIMFTRSLHASIEAGHANDCAQHYESVGFWYGQKI